MSQAGNLLEQRKQIFATLTDPVAYDLGCGVSVEDGFRGIDFLSNGEGVEKIDLYSYPWPIDDESVDYYRASHFVEHVPDWNKHFEQVWRTLKPGGHYEIIVPYLWNDRWFQDPDHKQATLGARFLYVQQAWRKKNRIDHYGARVNFDVVGWYELLDEDFLNQGFDPTYMAWAKRHLINVVTDVAIVLRKLPMEKDVE